MFDDIIIIPKVYLMTSIVGFQLLAYELRKQLNDSKREKDLLMGNNRKNMAGEIKEKIIQLDRVIETLQSNINYLYH